jgi:hypothetical protein
MRSSIPETDSIFPRTIDDVVPSVSYGNSTLTRDVGILENNKNLVEWRLLFENNKNLVEWRPWSTAMAYFRVGLGLRRLS